MRATRLTKTVLLAAGLALALSACGRRSDLDTPYEAQIDARRDAERAGETPPPAPQPPQPDRRFILDGLID